MQPPDESIPVEPASEPTSIDKAEARSEQAWDDAEKAAEDLKNLGHENDSDNEVDNP